MAGRLQWCLTRPSRLSHPMKTTKSGERENKMIWKSTVTGEQACKAIQPQRPMP